MTKFLQVGKKFNQKIKFNPVVAKAKPSISALNLLVLSLLVITGIGYLAEINSAVTKGYAIQGLQARISELRQQGSELSLQTLELQSMQTIQAKVSQLNMVAVGRVDYLAATPVAVANY